MPDYIGRIPVPNISPSGTFPIVPDYPWGRALAPEVHVHTFGSANCKIEQRFLAGMGAKRFLVKAQLNEARRAALKTFWEANQGSYGAFTYNAPNEGGGTTAHTCRFADQGLTLDALANAIWTTGVTLAEIPTEFPSYLLNATLARFPSSALEAALLQQAQEIIPLIHVTVRESGHPDNIYLSDRRCTVGGQLYQARLLTWDGISQEIGGASDQARFTFGNADRVMRDLANDTNLDRASVTFSLYHVGTGIKLDLWQGEVTGWQCDSGPEFTITASDGIYELTLPYPIRTVSRTCWKTFADGVNCPYSGPHQSCDKGFATPNGCQTHGMANYFGGIAAKPQGVRIKDYTQGKIPLTATSQVQDTIFGQVIPEVYTYGDMPVNCLIAAGREESEFYDAVGIVSEGPLSSFGNHRDQRLDGQPPHGPAPLGLRTSLGTDPNPDAFGLTSTGDPPPDERAAGTAFVEIRRTDAKGMQLSRVAEHEMRAVVFSGMGGWMWNAPGSRFWFEGLTNPVWIAVNALLRAKGLRNAPASQQEALFNVQAAISASLICDEVVDNIIGGGTEKQFTFRGVISQRQPLRDWLQNILANCLGYYTFACGKFKPGIRINSSTQEAFTAGNILMDSLRLAAVKPAFNRIVGNFADAEYQFATNAVEIGDEDHASEAGSASGPLWLSSEMNLCGTCGKSQAARIVTTRLREELGGITAEEWRKARELAFRTTVLALHVDPGMVCSMMHDDMPGGSGEFRVQGWRLNPDYSIDLWGRTTTDSMYDLTAGPKPADVEPEPLPEERIINLVPADVQPIGDDPFLIEQSADGVKVDLAITYNPPDPIDVFHGVAIHLVRPGCDPQHLGDFDYNGDPTGEGEARYGTCAVSHPQPVTEEQWDVYVVSRSRVYRKPLDLANSPRRTINVAARTIEASVPIANVSNVALVSITPIQADAVGLTGDVVAEVKLSYTAPDPLGNPPADFQGVHVWIKTPDGRIQDTGWQAYTGEAGATGHATLALPYPRQSESWRYHLVSRSEAFVNKLDLSATPYVDVDMPADPFTGDAPNVSLFRAGRSNGDGTFTREMYWDSRREKLLIDWAAVRPPQTIDWSGIKVYVRIPAEGGYLYFDCTGLIPPAAFEERDTAFGVQWIAWGAIAVEPASIPAAPQEWRFIAVSFDRDGNRNNDMDGNPTGPGITLTTLPKSDDVENFTANVEYGISEAGDQTFRFYGSWTNPTTPRYKGVRIVARWSGPPQVDVPVAIEQEGSSAFRTEAWTVAPGPRAVTLYAQTIYGNDTLKPITESTPRVHLTVEPQTGTSGQERAPLVTGQTAAVGYTTSEAGDQRYYFYGSWTPPADLTQFRGVKIVARPAAGNDLILAIETQEATSFRTDDWPVSYSNESWTIYFVSIDANNRANSVVPGTTPKVDLTVQKSYGPGGQEYAPLVTAFSASVCTATNEAGVQLFGFQGSWTNPADQTKFRGVKLVARPPGGDGTTDRILAVETQGATAFKTDTWPMPASAENGWVIYAVSVDANNRANSIVPGTTPSQTLNVTPGASGTLKAGRLDPTSLGGGLEVASSQLKAKIGAAMQLVSDAITVKLGSALEVASDLINVKQNGIVANMIQSVNASTIQGLILASQIQSIAATQITGLIASSQIQSLAADKISGMILAGQIQTLTAGQITGALAYTQIGSVNAQTITINQLVDSQILSVSVGKLIAGTASFTGDAYFQNTGSIYLFNGGNLYISPGTIYGTTAHFKSAGYGWEIIPGLAGELRCAGAWLGIHVGLVKVQNATVINTAGQFTGNGVDCPYYGIGGSGHNTYYGGAWRYGITAAPVAYKRPDDSTGYLWFYGGVLTAVT